MERVDKLALQDKQLQADIENTQLLIKRLDNAARGICRCGCVSVVCTPLFYRFPPVGHTCAAFPRAAGAQRCAHLLAALT